MLLFSALQLQVGLQSNVPQPHELFEEDDDVDAALSELQISLEGSATSSGHRGNITQMPKLQDTLRFFRPKRFTLKSFKAACFVLHDLTMTAYKSATAANQNASPNSDGVF